jgi:hypothetical protein
MTTQPPEPREVLRPPLETTSVGVKISKERGVPQRSPFIAVSGVPITGSTMNLPHLTGSGVTQPEHRGQAAAIRAVMLRDRSSGHSTGRGGGVGVISILLFALSFQMCTGLFRRPQAICPHSPWLACARKPHKTRFTAFAHCAQGPTPGRWHHSLTRGPGPVALSRSSPRADLRVSLSPRVVPRPTLRDALQGAGDPRLRHVQVVCDLAQGPPLAP